MDTFKLAFSLALTLVLAGCASAPSTDTVADSTTKTAAQPLADAEAQAAASNAIDDPIVCSYEQTTGTRIKQNKKVCRRQSEIENASRDAGDMLRDVERASGGMGGDLAGPGTGGG